MSAIAWDYSKYLSIRACSAIGQVYATYVAGIPYPSVRRVKCGEEKIQTTSLDRAKMEYNLGVFWGLRCEWWAIGTTIPGSDCVIPASSDLDTVLSLGTYHDNFFQVSVDGGVHYRDCNLAEFADDPIGGTQIGRRVACLFERRTLAKACLINSDGSGLAYPPQDTLYW